LEEYNSTIFALAENVFMAAKKCNSRPIGDKRENRVAARRNSGSIFGNPPSVQRSRKCYFIAALILRLCNFPRVGNSVPLRDVTFCCE
jgi:hypothetical protein